jgi:hypothetical protein
MTTAPASGNNLVSGRELFRAALPPPHPALPSDTFSAARLTTSIIISVAIFSQATSNGGQSKVSVTAGLEFVSSHP